MKVLKYLSVVLAGVFLFIACQKETSFENPLPDVFASGSLQSVGGNCAPIVVNGVYKQDSTLGEGNNVSVQVRITSPGKYVIFTDTQNGFSFKDSSYITDTGLHTFTLKATGSPVATQTTDFIVAFDSSICLFSVPVIGNTGAMFSLEGSPGSCSNALVQGDYEVGTALTTSNTVAITVNVSTVGSYTINTGSVSGMTFNASGTFTSTGVQTISLQGTGTPTTEGTTTIPITVGNSNCSFVVEVDPDPASIDPNFSDTAWQFTEATSSYNGPFYDVFDTTVAGLGTALVMIGYTPFTADTILFTQILFPGNNIQPGTYNTTSIGQNFFFTDYTDTADAKDIYKANSNTLGSNMQITISSYNATTGIILGTFSGLAVNASNVPVTITQGRFRGRVR